MCWDQDVWTASRYLPKGNLFVTMGKGNLAVEKADRCHRSTVPRVHIHWWGQFCISQCGELRLPHDSGCISANKPTTAPWVSHRKRSETHKQRASLKTFLKKVNVINYKTEELFQWEMRWLSKATDRLHADLKKQRWKRTVTEWLVKCEYCL